MEDDDARNLRGTSLEAVSGGQTPVACRPSRGTARRRQPERQDAEYGDAATPTPGGATAVKGDSARLRKIARIRKALTEGSYTIDASDVADKLIDHMLGQ